MQHCWKLKTVEVELCTSIRNRVFDVLSCQFGTEIADSDAHRLDKCFYFRLFGKAVSMISKWSASIQKRYDHFYNDSGGLSWRLSYLFL